MLFESSSFLKKWSLTNRELMKTVVYLMCCSQKNEARTGHNLESHKLEWNAT